MSSPEALTTLTALERALRGRRNSSGLLVHVDGQARPLSWQSNTRRWPRTSRDVFAATFLLRQVLVADVVRAVLEAAQYWLKSASLRSDTTVVGPEAWCTPYVASAPVEGAGPHPVRRLVVTICSRELDRDGGGDGDPVVALRSGWTWFEAGVAMRSVPPLLLLRNVHASAVLRTHTVVVESTGGDEGARWVRALRPGDTITVLPMARSPRWRNHVWSVQIEVYTSALR